MLYACFVVVLQVLNEGLFCREFLEAAKKLHENGKNPVTITTREVQQILITDEIVVNVLFYYKHFSFQFF